MLLRVLWSLPLLAAALWCNPVLAGPPGLAAGPHLDARAWLERIRLAAKERNYHGTMVFSAGDVVSSSRVGHFCVGDQVYERIEALDGQQQQVYRHNDVVHTLWPSRRVATIEKGDVLATEFGLPRIELRLQEQYEVKVLQPERLAGRDAHVLLLRPRDVLRFAQRLWADRDTGLMLRADVLGPGGQLLESTAFSDLEIGARPQRESVVGPMRRLDGFRVLNLQPVATTLEAEGWSLGSLPAGFRLVGSVRRGIGDPADGASGSAVQALQAVFSDGLARVSVFIETHDAARTRQALMTQMGATHTLMRPLKERWWVTVMGDVPPSTLKQFVAALERHP